MAVWGLGGDSICHQSMAGRFAVDRFWAGQPVGDRSANARLAGGPFVGVRCGGDPRVAEPSQTEMTAAVGQPAAVRAMGYVEQSLEQEMQRRAH